MTAARLLPNDSPNADVRARINACRGLSTRLISDRLADVDLEALTRELLVICAERSDTGAFSTFPLTVRHTMHGDGELADWTLRYGESGTSVERTENGARPGVAVDAHVRWEYWEDGVRLINDDVSALSLFTSRRVAAIGEGDARTNGHCWFLGVNFTGDPDPDRPGRVIASLRDRVGENDEHVEAIVKGEILDKLLHGRARVLADSLSDLGGSPLLAGSFLRWEVAGHDRVAQISFAAAGSWRYRSLSSDEAAAEDPSSGVTVHFAGVRPFLSVAGGKEELAAQLVRGAARLTGEDARLRAFAAAMRCIHAPGETSGWPVAPAGSDVLGSAMPLVPLPTAERGDVRGALLVVVHGKGEDERRAIRLAERLDPVGRYHVLAPRAPYRVPGGYSWFPTLGPRTTGPTIEQLRRSVLDTCEAYGHEPCETILVGFSEGAAAAVGAAYGRGSALRPRSVVSLCGFAPRHVALEPAPAPPSALVLRGKADRTVLQSDADYLAATLERLGARVTYQTCYSSHRVSRGMLAEVASWLQSDSVHTISP
jgi:predicted esterase